jgi:hypothetical protein
MKESFENDSCLFKRLNSLLFEELICACIICGIGYVLDSFFCSCVIRWMFLFEAQLIIFEQNVRRECMSAQKSVLRTKLGCLFFILLMRYKDLFSLDTKCCVWWSNDRHLSNICQVACKICNVLRGDADNSLIKSVPKSVTYSKTRIKIVIINCIYTNTFCFIKESQF